MLADFRQVEENFRVLDSQTRERIATSTQPKGALLEEIFGETDHIHRSDQGKSFDAFWKFLMSPARLDELREWLRDVHALEAIRDLLREDFVRNIPPMLWTQVTRSTAQSRNSWISCAVSSPTRPAHSLWVARHS